MTLSRLSETNMIASKRVLAAGDRLIGYHCASDFSCFIGSIVSDVKVRLELAFSHDEVDANGHWITDESMSKCHWDVIEKVLEFEPGKLGKNSVYIITNGRWLRATVEIKDEAPKELRFYLRGRTF